MWPVIASGSIRWTDKELEVGSYRIPANRVVVMPFACMFRGDRWGNPDTFLPERWLSEPHTDNHTNITHTQLPVRPDSQAASDKQGVRDGLAGQNDAWTSHAFVPFSYGPRNCAGQSLAKYVTPIVLGHCFWRFDFKEAHEGGLPTSGKWFITWAPRGGVHVSVKERRGPGAHH
eukprot:GDKI01033262.1.p1 GENE.GDKI01033262.1~~GDKI01033262.1.p1  ORF type:complete len:197 (-),score=22.35 GDKI01033262.1:232-753(-)